MSTKPPPSTPPTSTNPTPTGYTLHRLYYDAPGERHQALVLVPSIPPSPSPSSPPIPTPDLQPPRGRFYHITFCPPPQIGPYYGPNMCVARRRVGCSYAQALRSGIGQGRKMKFERRVDYAFLSAPSLRGVGRVGWLPEGGLEAFEGVVEGVGVPGEEKERGQETKDCVDWVEKVLERVGGMLVWEEPVVEVGSGAGAGADEGVEVLVNGSMEEEMAVEECEDWGHPAKGGKSWVPADEIRDAWVQPVHEEVLLRMSRLGLVHGKDLVA